MADILELISFGVFVAFIVAATAIFCNSLAESWLQKFMAQLIAVMIILATGYTFLFDHSENIPYEEILRLNERFGRY